MCQPLYCASSNDLMTKKKKVGAGKAEALQSARPALGLHTLYSELLDLRLETCHRLIQHCL